MPLPPNKKPRRPRGPWDKEELADPKLIIARQRYAEAEATENTRNDFLSNFLSALGGNIAGIAGGLAVHTGQWIPLILFGTTMMGVLPLMARRNIRPLPAIVGMMTGMVIMASAGQSETLTPVPLAEMPSPQQTAAMPQP